MPAIPVDSWYIGAGDIYLDAVRIGATRENNVFRIARELDAGIMNGIGGKLARTDYYVRRPYPVLEFSFAEFSPTSFPLIVPGATAAPDVAVPDDIIVSPPAVRRLGADAYHEWMLRVPGVDGKDVALVIPLGINVNDAEFTAADAADPTVVRMTIEGRFDPDDDTAPAWTIRLVGAAGS
jgi:hypothetical protein